MNPSINQTINAYLLTGAQLDELLFVLALKWIDQLGRVHLLTAKDRKTCQQESQVRRDGYYLQSSFVEEFDDGVGSPRAIHKAKILRRGHLAGPPNL